MSSAIIYKINKKGYLLFASVKTVSGFRIGVEPYVQLSPDIDKKTIAEQIKAVVDYDDSKRVPDPKNWTEFDNLFLQRTGLKSMKDLNKLTTKNVGIKKEDDTIIFMPTKHAEPPDEGFVNISKNEPNIIVPFTASNDEIVQALELALSRCE